MSSTSEQQQRRWQPPQPDWQQQWRSMLPWMLLALLLAFTWVQFTAQPGPRELTYTQFKQEVAAGDVPRVTVRGDQIRGVLKLSAAEAESRETGWPARHGDLAENEVRFTTTRPAFEDPELMPLLKEHDVTIRAESPGPSWWQDLLAGVLPWLLLLGLIIYGMRRMQSQMGGAGGMFNFGKSRAKRYREQETDVAMDDVAGSENAKRDVAEIIDYLKQPERYRSLGAEVPKGVLLMGPPGTGKTLLAKAVAGEAGVPFYSISGSEFIEMLVGVGAARVRDTFNSAKEESPAIIFIDELDSIGRVRGAGLGGGHDEREQTLNQILAEMDGFEPHETVVVLAATNRPDVLDPALMRPGRFDRKVSLNLPDRAARRSILAVHAGKVVLADDVDLDRLAGKTVGFSGADLSNLVNEAALLAGRDRKQAIDNETLEQAREKITLGPKREDAIDDDEKEVIAYHETGHTLAALLLPNADRPDRVTVIPRGQALGATEQTPERERYNLRRPYLLDRIGVMLGGRTAEKIVYGEVSTGAENDLKQATKLARRMISQWGMSERLGPVAFQEGEQHPFLGREMSQGRDFSEHTAQMIDDEVRRLIMDVEDKVEKLLRQHRNELDRIAQALLERETLQAEDLQQLMEASRSESA